MRTLLRLVLAASLLGLVGIAVLGSTDEGQRLLHRIERRVHFLTGWPLPGTPDLARFHERLAEKQLALGDRVFIRIFKREQDMELWMRRDDRYVLFATYPICRYSGRLGPKLKEGDRQAPEGFYTVSKAQLNPNSRWHRSFNLGFPNAYDRSKGRTGSFLMVHGGCASIGCYAMTDKVVDEIWRLVTAALNGGQSRFHVHIFPFRMTERALSSRAGSQWNGFWRDLKRGHDAFEASLRPPRVAVCNGTYTFAPAASAAGDTPIRNDCSLKLAKD